jgi:hypothetical protein
LIISTSGKIYNDNGVEMHYTQSNSGYKQVGSGNNKQYVHRLVAKKYVYNPDPENKVYVDHINSNKLDNRAENLQWLTPKENAQKAVKDGLYNIDSEKRKAAARINVLKTFDINRRVTVLFGEDGYYIGEQKSRSSSGHSICRIAVKGKQVRDYKNLMESYGFIPERIKPIVAHEVNVRKYYVIGKDYGMNVLYKEDSIAKILNVYNITRDSLMYSINFRTSDANGIFWQIEKK